MASAPDSLRIAHVVEAALTGVARHVTDLVAAQVRAGHEVHVVYAPDRAEPGFAEGLAAGGAVVTPLSMATAPGVRDVPAWIGLRRVLRRIAPLDVAHAHSSKAGALVRLQPSSRLLGAWLLAYTPHAIKTLDPALARGARTAYGLIERTLARRPASCVIAVSDEERDHMASLGFPPDRLFTVPNGTDVAGRGEAALSKRELCGTDDALVALFVGRLEPQKAPLRLIEAAALLPEDLGRAVRVVLVGEGSLREECERRIAALGLENVVVMAGRRPGVAAMRGADVFVLPSDYETFPISVVEAVQCGLPVVVTRVGGAARLVAHGESGFVTGFMAEEIAQGLTALLASPELRASASAAARLRAPEFGAARMAARTEAVYREMLGRRAGR